MSEMSSLSKKWRLAVKNNLFQGSFKDFADQYNSTFEDDEYYSANAADTMGIKKPVIDSTTITPSDLKPIDTSKVEEVKILGMSKSVFGFVAVGVVLLVGGGIYYAMKKGKKGEE